MSKKNKQENNDDYIVKSSKENREEETTSDEQPKVDPETQLFYDKYEQLVKETGKVISPEMRYSHQGIYPVLTITNVPEESKENTAG